MTTYCRLSFPLPVNQTFLYRLPEELKGRVRPGTAVLAPFGPRKIKGYVLETTELSASPGFQVKDICGVLENCQVLPPVFLNFVQKLAWRSLSSAGLFLELAEGPARAAEVKEKVIITEKGKEELQSGQLRGKNRQLLEQVNQKAFSPTFLKRKLKWRDLNARLKSLEQAGLIEIKQKVKRVKSQLISPRSLPRQLSLPVDFSEEDSQVSPVFQALAAGEFRRFLLNGESRKRQEVIFKMVRQALEGEGYVFILVPEIEQMARWWSEAEVLGSNVAIYHSRLAEKKRKEIWVRIISGQSRVVIGTRAILFLPVNPVRLIVVDEVQNDLYDQAESPPFDVREGAQIRAKEEGAVLLFSSSTPPVSCYYLSQAKGESIDLGQGERHYICQLSRKDIGRWLQEELLTEVGPGLRAGQKVFFFINRKGYAGYLVCPACGYVPRCPTCQIPLILDKKKNELVCRYCGQSLSQQETCPVCHHPMKPGRIKGSQFLVERLKKLLPDFSLALLEEGEGKQSIEDSLNKLDSGQVQLVVGTDYALPRLQPGSFSMVIVVEPEIGLSLPDFKAAEKTFIRVFKASELLANQASSKMMVITAMPDQPAIKFGTDGDYPGFYRQELEYRQLLKYPPFSLLICLTLTGRNLRKVAGSGRRLVEELALKFPALEIIGPKVKPRLWQKQQKEVRLYLRLEKNDDLLALHEFLAIFSRTSRQARLSYRLLF
ncbi:MAG TPA: primosomal protein N' [Candidatus Saccharicenans sp.]|nr:primosomal protein N' [Candidatus Saccharicenans sp.]HPU93569.1 primosomal protein N' [Candidatus Saccharicenans sp.]